METPPAPPSTLPVRELPVRELPIVAGQLALDFANTVDDPDGVARFDHVADLTGLLHWAGRVGLAGEERLAALRTAAARHPDDAGRALRAAHALRRTIDDTFRPVTEGRPVPDAAWRELREAAARAVAHADLVADVDPVTGHLTTRLAWPTPGSVDDLLLPMAHSALELATGPDLARVKHCAGCPWLYVDRSRNGSRRWCSMDDCGTHEKIRRYVTRRAERRARSAPRA